MPVNVNLESLAKGLVFVIAAVPGLSTFYEALPHLPGQKQIYVAAASGAAFITAAYVISAWKRLTASSDYRTVFRLVMMGAGVIVGFFLVNAIYNSRVVSFNVGDRSCELVAPLRLPAETSKSTEQGVSLGEWATKVGCHHARNVFARDPIGQTMSLVVGLIGTILVSVLFTSAAALGLIRLAHSWTGIPNADHDDAAVTEKTGNEGNQSSEPAVSEDTTESPPVDGSEEMPRGPAG